MNDFRIHEAVPEEIPEIYRIFEQTLPEVWNEADLRNEIDYPYACFLSAVSGHKVIGFLSARFVFGDGELLNIAVAEDARRKGVAESLIREMLFRAEHTDTEQIVLEVRASNFAAQRLYEKKGFIKQSVRPHYYEKPDEDAYFYLIQMGEK